MMLKSRHHLLSLKVTFRFNAAAPEIVLDLERIEKGQNTINNRWRVPAEAIGVPSDPSTVRALNLTLPPSVLEPLTTEVQEAAMDADEPLWLCLEPPYGCVGGFDWEDVLIEALKRPVLRLPDFLERPREDDATLDVALICDLPNDEPKFPVGQTIADLTVWAHASPRHTTRLNVFVSSAWRPEVSRALEKYHPSKTIVLHEAPDDPSLDWFGWVERAVRGQSIDVVHFMTPGYFVYQQPTLVMTGSPALSNRTSTGSYLTPSAVSDFLTKLGAWASVYSSPPHGRSAAVRCFADALAQMRPGPVLCQSMDRREWIDELKTWIQFLFAPVASTPPHALGALCYCQPQLVEGVEYRSDFRGQELDLTIPVQAPITIAEAPTGSWFSSALRSREAAVQQQRAWTSDDATLGVKITTQSFRASEVLSDSIAEFDRIVAAHSKKGVQT